MNITPPSQIWPSFGENQPKITINIHENNSIRLTLQPLSTARWNDISWRGITVKMPDRQSTVFGIVRTFEENLLTSSTHSSSQIIIGLPWNITFIFYFRKSLWSYRSGRNLLNSIEAFFISMILYSDHNNWHIFIDKSQWTMLEFTRKNSFTVHICNFFDFLDFTVTSGSDITHIIRVISYDSYDMSRLATRFLT